MKALKNLWRKLTHTKALEKSSGKLEMGFFETVYRVTYLSGMSSVDDEVLYMIYSSAIKLSIFLLVSCEIWYACTRTSALDEVAASINTTLLQLITIYRYWTMIYHREVFDRLAKSMDSPYFDSSTEKRKQLIEYWSKKNEKYLKLLLFLGHCALAAWIVYPLLDDVDYNLFIAIRLPFDYRSPLRYAFTYIITAVSFTYIALFVMTNDLIMQAHLLHLVCQFDVLSDCLENILTDCELELKGEFVNREKFILTERFTTSYLKRLGHMVYQHQSILRHVAELRSTLSRPMLGQLAASGTLICFIGYEAATTASQNITKCLMSLLFLSYNLFEFYIFCRWGEEITVQSDRVGDAAYCSGWEQGVSSIPGVKSNLVLIVARSKKPLILTAGGMYNLSLMSYTSLVKTSYSALTVLLRFRQN